MARRNTRLSHIPFTRRLVGDITLALMGIPRTFASVVLAITGLIASSGVFSGECPGGTPSDQECIRQLADLEKKLAAVYLEKEAQLTKLYGESGYGGTEGQNYLREAIQSFRETNNAWRAFRDTECWYFALRDGMSLSPDYASPVSSACKVQRTAERIKVLTK